MYKISNIDLIKNQLKELETQVNDLELSNDIQKLIDKAKNCGVDYVKFQIYQTREMALKNLKKAPYQARNSLTGKENQYKILQSPDAQMLGLYILN